MDKTFNDYKHYAEDFLQRYFGVNTARNFKCLNPLHNDDNPSMGYEKGKCRAHCFGCDAYYDLYDLVGLYFGIENKGEQLKKVQELYDSGALYSRKIPTPKVKKVETKKLTAEQLEKNQGEIKAYIKDCIDNVHKTTYWHDRGLTDETIVACKLGYDEKKDAVVIPYSRALNYYQLRFIKDKKFYKPPTNYAGEEPLYNEQAMRLKTRVPIFIVESPICALSITQCGGNAVALCGVSCYMKVVNIAKIKKPTGTLIICLDNDEKGKEHTEKLVKELSKIKDVKYIVRNIADNCKDPNELLIKDEKKLSKNIEDAIRDAKRLTQTEYDSFSAYELDTMDIKPPEFIVENMIPTGLSLLASPTKYGKSWAMLQLCRSVALGTEFLGHKCNKHDCLYLALEDSKARLQSRQKKQGNGQRSPKGLFYSIKAPTLDKMRLITYLAEQIDENPNIKLIVIDTLQKVRSHVIDKNTNDYANDYKELSILKEFADDNKIAILLVHHSRKMADPNDPFNNILGSTGIQGVLDTMIVLYKTKRGDDNTTIEMTGRDIPSSSTIITFDKREGTGTFLWEVVGTPEEQQALKEKRDYDDNLVVRAILKLIEKNPSGWSGKATDLMNAIYDVTGQCYAGSSSGLGKEIQSLKPKLYSRSGIELETSRSGIERKITIKKKSKYPSWLSRPTYTQTEIE